MPWHARDGGAWRTITAPAVRVAGAWRAVQEAWVRDGGTWRRFFVAMTAAASPDLANGGGFGGATSNSVTATPTGGTAPYTYAWSRVSGDATISISSTAAATVSWSATLSPGQTKTATWVCTITDAGGVQAVTNTVDITLSDFS